MPDPSKLQWPLTYLGRLQAVAAELQNIGAAAPVEILLQRFENVTATEIEAILNALVLFGRVEKKGNLYSVLPEP